MELVVCEDCVTEALDVVVCQSLELLTIILEVSDRKARLVLWHLAVLEEEQVSFKAAAKAYHFVIKILNL